MSKHWCERTISMIHLARKTADGVRLLSRALPGLPRGLSGRRSGQCDRRHRPQLLEPRKSRIRRGLGPRLLTVLLLTSLLGGCRLPTSSQPELPVPLDKLIPPEWELLPQGRGKLGIQEVSIDDDPESEWLIFFHYDNAPNGALGPVGGIIYDAQYDASRYDPHGIIPFPYQPSTFLVPYRLLPDWHVGKGQGYLALRTVAWDQVRTGFGDELIVFGDGRPGTRLSIFWWQGIDQGYGVSHFVGTLRVDTDQAEPGQLINRVVTYDRLNDRSNLCKQVVYLRRPGTHRFTPGPPTIVFCQGVPQQPTYPEAVVLAWLLAPRDELLFEGARATLRPKLPPAPPRRVTRIVYSGEAERSGEGQKARSAELVTTTIDGSAGLQTFQWRLEEMRPRFITDTARWRIVDVEPQP